MPTYQYACTQCGHSFEQFQSFSDDSLEHCPECNGRLRKVFNAVGVVFKGSGFYRNDSRAATSSSLTSEGAKSVAKDSGSSSGDSSSDSSSGSSSGGTSGGAKESSGSTPTKTASTSSSTSSSSSD